MCQYCLSEVQCKVMKSTVIFVSGPQVIRLQGKHRTRQRGCMHGMYVWIDIDTPTLLCNFLNTSKCCILYPQFQQTRPATFSCVESHRHSNAYITNFLFRSRLLFAQPYQNLNPMQIATIASINAALSQLAVL